jgi:hypothetical protein
MRPRQVTIGWHVDRRDGYDLLVDATYYPPDPPCRGPGSGYVVTLRCPTGHTWDSWTTTEIVPGTTATRRTGVAIHHCPVCHVGWQSMTWDPAHAIA